MKNKVLIIGEYIPQNWRSKEKIDEIAEKIKDKGASPILLSASWCDLNESNFCGDVYQLSDSAMFYKRYFVDPIQIREENSCSFTALFSLACKVIDAESPQLVIFAERIKYLPIVMLLKNYYNMKFCLFPIEHFFEEGVNCINETRIMEMVALFDYSLENEKMAKEICKAYKIQHLSLDAILDREIEIYK